MKEADPDAEGRVMAATAAMLDAGRQRNEAALHALFAEIRMLAALLPGAAHPPVGDDDRFDDVPV